MAPTIGPGFRGPLPHDQIAVLAAGHIAGHVPASASATNPAWWGQGIAVSYEQQLGRRIPGQTSRGDFQVGVSKTYRGDLDAALHTWLDVVAGRTRLGSVLLDGEPRIFATKK